jgi:hypothetical protein
VIWITMLAMCDKNGEVAASIPGLAKTAGVSLEKTEIALQKFLSPDKYSRTKDHEGRRVEEIDGGWLLLNHAAYRAKRQEEHRKEYRANWMREKRELEREQKREQNEPPCTNTDTDTDTDTVKDSREYKFAQSMYQKILESFPKAKKPNMSTWAKTVERTCRIDDREIEELWRVFLWANSDDFWSANILSPETLRKKYDHLSAQMTRGRSNGKPTVAQIARHHATDQSWAD